MDKIKYYVDALQSTSGRLEKMEILKEGLQFQSFKEVVVFLLDSNITTGISTKKINKKLNIHMPNAMLSFSELLEYLKINNTGSDENIAVAQNTIEVLNLHEELAIKIITKSLKLGVDAKTVNKVYPNLIPTFDVMLGSSFDKCKLKPNEYIWITEKLNGVRAIYKQGKLYSRQGKEFKGLDHIIYSLKLLTNHMGDEYVFDGELGLSDINLTNSERFQVATGIINSDNEAKTNIHYTLFDALPLDEFNDGASIETYSKRRDVLECLFDKYNLPHLDLVTRFYEGTDHSQIDFWLKYTNAYDIEGLMLNLDSVYECKRTKKLIKVKSFKDCDIRCIDIEVGTGKNENTLGAIICEYKGNTVKVGSGFTDEQRNAIWSNPNSILNKIVTVKYKEETKNKKNDLYSLQFPVFIGIREDKNEVNYAD